MGYWGGREGAGFWKGREGHRPGFRDHKATPTYHGPNLYTTPLTTPNINQSCRSFLTVSSCLLAACS